MNNVLPSYFILMKPESPATVNQYEIRRPKFCVPFIKHVFKCITLVIVVYVCLTYYKIVMLTICLKCTFS